MPARRRRSHGPSPRGRSPHPESLPQGGRGGIRGAAVMRRIPATIVTGFLGAGKTSLVRHLLTEAAGHRLAVIVNEFGELGIDRELMLGCGDAACSDHDIVELANGCLCC